MAQPQPGVLPMDPLAPLPPLPPSRVRHSTSPDAASLLEGSVPRKRGNAHVDESSARFDSAVATYGMQLKAWIDMQVDQRLTQVWEGELQVARRESASALALGGRFEAEVRSITDAQTKLLAVVEGISEEIGRLKAAMAACQLSTQLHTAAGSAGTRDEDTVLAVEKAAVALEELRHSVNNIQSQDSSTLAELGRHEVAIQELRRHQEQHFMRQAAELTDAAGAMKGTRREVNELVGLIQRMENKFATLKTEVTEELRGFDHRRKAELSAHGELETRLADELAALHRRLSSEVRGELAASLQKEAFTQQDLHTLLDESKRDLRRLVSEAQGKNEDDLREIARAQHRQIADLRAEITAAFKSEASAVAALDEQIWLTDQRLGQRIDEIVHHTGSGDRARGKVVMERVGELSGMDTTTTRARPALQANSSRGSLAMARVAGDTFMEAVETPLRAAHTKAHYGDAYIEGSDEERRPVRSLSRSSRVSQSNLPRRQSALTMARSAGEALMEAAEHSSPLVRGALETE